MARRNSIAAQKPRRQSVKLSHQGHLSAPLSPPTSKGKHPQGIRKRQKQNPLRRSARLDRLIEANETQPKASQQPLPSPVSDFKGPNRAHPPPTLLPSKPLKRKRATEQQLNPPSPKRPRTSCPSPSVQDVDSVTYWTQTYHWPPGYFNESGEMNHLLARKKSTASLRRKRSDSESGAPSSATPSDQKPRDEKSAPYQNARYETVLATKDSFMGKYGQGTTNESKRLCQQLLDAQPTVPQDTMFSDEYFEETCEAIRNKNEARVIRDISLLIVASAEVLAIRGNQHCRLLIESVNEGWNNSIPLTKPRPQPDYSVGFRREAFTETQLQKLQPFVGDLTDNSFFMGTWYMYFPFFSSEVKCGAAALDVADRQNAHSMTLAVRGVVELFRLVKREQELHREILAFSISHDHRSVRIYGHYPVIEGRKTTFYRHPIHTFDFTALDGKEKWTAYKFTKSVYDIWMPAHFKSLCSAIDAIPPDIHFEVSEESDLQFPSSSGLSQGLESHHLSDSGATGDDELRLHDPQELTPETSITQTSEQARFKKPKKR
ncbi:hypothetical protein LTR99_005568 [Exophiala xenobiotica]|uniref:DUF7924 domain-containing protein n=1 Tax=Vermiconidia calcicola TaxID=1690605 RepID=A0AAV9PPY2_9PEZI|nr:hypothetical protein LTR72_011602 [Exophiala xenobiotica]KAK5527589.1 hypothetical protein LTR25_011068 [Vermiconidia calcicola]KAK5529007.1 hypothetical protein LTR23_010881 [Chaetothyriales sp. CCFEE 6169]KAK5231823.1 hypothetical protein LTR47_007226 [Exophiala xenobiotica]KAK5243815.1 hypothetical protein LTS06_010495 [Exophiala xenobiotica]